MIGNLDLIIDKYSEKKGLDRRLVEVIAVETFKRLKTRMVHSDALSLHITDLGYFIPMNTRLRRYIRENITKVRKQRKRVKELSGLLESAKSEERIAELTKKLEVAILFRDVYTYNLTNALSQLNALRTVWYEKANRRKANKLKREQNELATGISENTV